MTTKHKWQDNQPTDDTPDMWRNRIVRYGDADVSDLLANPYNLRIHGQAQQAYMLGILRDVGIIDTICINETTGHLVDGHLRMVLAERFKIPTLPARWIAVTEAEEAEILLTFDWITGLATYDSTNTDALLRMVNTDNASVQAMLTEMASSQGLYFGDTSFDFDEGNAPRTSPYASDNGHSENGATDTQPSHIRMVQLFLTVDTIDEFNDLIKELAEQYETDNPTDTVMEALRRAVHTS